MFNLGYLRIRWKNYFSEQVLFEFVILDKPSSPELSDLTIEMLLLTTSHALGLNGILKKINRLSLVSLVLEECSLDRSVFQRLCLVSLLFWSCPTILSRRLNAFEYYWMCFIQRRHYIILSLTSLLEDQVYIALRIRWFVQVKWEPLNKTDKLNENRWIKLKEQFLSLIKTSF